MLTEKFQNGNKVEFENEAKTCYLSLDHRRHSAPGAMATRANARSEIDQGIGGEKQYSLMT